MKLWEMIELGSLPFWIAGIIMGKPILILIGFFLFIIGKVVDL